VSQLIIELYSATVHLYVRVCVWRCVSVFNFQELDLATINFVCVLVTNNFGLHYAIITVI